MNVFNKPTEGHVSITLKQSQKKDRMNINMGFSLNKENSFIKGKTLSGLCCNCDNNMQCDWQRENKIFCEHYQ
jgi:hypothetical protein